MPSHNDFVILILIMMIPSNPNQPMSREDIKRFRSGIARRMSGDFTPQERERYNRAKNTYDVIIKNNGGKNPILGI